MQKPCVAGVANSTHLNDVRAQGFDDAFIQLWRFYLAYCEAGFDENRIDVVHLQVSKEKIVE